MPNQNRFFKIHFNFIIPYPHISSLQEFFEVLYARFLCVMRASKCASSILNAINCIQYSYCIDVTSCVWVIRYRRFGINMLTHLHGAKYSLIFRHYDMRPLGCHETSKSISKGHDFVNHSNWWSEWEGFIAGNKNSNMQDITVFWGESFWDPHK